MRVLPYNIGPYLSDGKCPLIYYGPFLESTLHADGFRPSASWSLSLWGPREIATRDLPRAQLRVFPTPFDLRSYSYHCTNQRETDLNLTETTVSALPRGPELTPEVALTQSPRAMPDRGRLGRMGQCYRSLVHPPAQR